MKIRAESINTLKPGARFCAAGECWMVVTSRDNDMVVHLDTGKLVHWSHAAAGDEEIEVLT